MPSRAVLFQIYQVIVMYMPVLSPRLAAAASFVRPGARLADIGTDHAALPISLMRSGVLTDSLGTDLSQGPLQIAERRIADAGLSGRIHLMQTDGLRGVDAFEPSDITICGMGGKTILGILSTVSWIRDDRIRLVLQPQTFIPLVRTWLLRESFLIDDERLVFDRGKYYTVLCSHYSSGPAESPWSDAELLVGRRILEQHPPELRPFLEKICVTLRIQISGLCAEGKDPSGLESSLKEIDMYLRSMYPGTTV